MAKKICLQAGHKGRTTGATGAHGEQEFTTKITPKIATILREHGFQVYEADANANTDGNVVGQDWDLFLAIHYDADIYNDRGGFLDIPDASVDMAHEESKRIHSILRTEYFSGQLGIPEKANRSNKNTKFYYMWQYLTSKTPCVLIECGVGNRKPEDYNTLFNRMDEVAEVLARGIGKAFGVNIFESPFNFDHTKKMPDEAWYMLGYDKQEPISREWALDTVGVEYTKLYNNYQELRENAEDCEDEQEELQGLREANKKQLETISGLENNVKSLSDTVVILEDKVEKLELAVSGDLSKLSAWELFSLIFKRK